jgi:flagellar assembly protein FliH
MTMNVRKFEYPELTPRKVSNPDGKNVLAYQEQKFEAQVNQASVEKAHKGGDSSFKLDQIVVNQLGIEDREKAAQEVRIVKEIERRWEQSVEKAEVVGYTRGLEEGKAEAYRAEMPRILERLQKLDHVLQEFDKFRERIFAANESFLMDLIGEVVGMVVLKEIEVDRDYVKRLVVTLLHQLSTRDDLKIYLSQADFSNLEELKRSIDKEFGKLSNTSFEASDEIPVGGCKIETRFGVVDASIASQIENVKKALKA